MYRVKTQITDILHRAACVGENLSPQDKKKNKVIRINPPKLLASAENLVGMPDGSRQTDNKLEGEYSEQHQSRNVVTHKGVAKKKKKRNPFPINPMPNASHHWLQCVSQNRLITAKPLEAVQASLLLLSLVDGIHALLELASSSFSRLSLLALLFDSLEAPTVVLNWLGWWAILELLHLCL